MSIVNTKVSGIVVTRIMGAILFDVPSYEIIFLSHWAFNMRCVSKWWHLSVYSTERENTIVYSF